MSLHKSNLYFFSFHSLFTGKKPAPFDLIPANDSEIKVNENALLKQEDLVPMEPGSLEKTARTLSRPTDRVFSDYRTTSSQYNAVVGGIPSSCM